MKLLDKIVGAFIGGVIGVRLGWQLVGVERAAPKHAEDMPTIRLDPKSFIAAMRNMKPDYIMVAQFSDDAGSEALRFTFTDDGRRYATSIEGLTANRVPTSTRADDGDTPPKVTFPAQLADFQRLYDAACRWDFTICGAAYEGDVIDPAAVLARPSPPLN